ncbi:nose resistant to fluoxetine protein 6 isoform X2 [Leptinotarsa decemlineata]|uniref:nose resistant to fluoxetine protein 6 isoform X2 n=1 Tax=Leptinotarsa decemlineata TaxID=7539 RepID=UPI003D307171
MILQLPKIVICLVIISNLHVTSSKNIFHGYSKYITNYISNLVENAVGKTQCASDLKSLAHDLINMERWALEMVDSSGKVASGILAGHIYMTGNFDQCLEIREQKNDTLINGQYCTVTLTHSKTNSGPFDFLLNTAAVAEFLGITLNSQSKTFLKVIRLHYGICIPHSCSIGNLQSIWDYIEHTFKAPIHVNFQDMMCRVKGKEVEPYFFDKYIIAIFVVYFILLVVCTWYDLTIHQQNDENTDNYIVAFSLYTNAKKLFTSKTGSQDKSVNNLKSINGIKVLSMLWVIMGHRCIMNFFSGATNTVYAHQLKERIEFLFIISASYAVDTFLFLSGFLLSYGIFKNQELLKKRKQFPVIPMYIYRFLRLSPALIATILFYVSVFKKMNDGPGWPLYSRKLAGSCALNWWATLLFISNYLDISHQCVEQAWYLAVDSQLFFISPIILIYFLKMPWRTSSMCIVACIISALYAFVITVQNELGATYIEGNQAYLERIYGSTFVRMPPYLIGLIFGFLLYKYQKIKIPMVTNLFLWISTFAACCALIAVHQVFTGNNYDSVRAGLFNSCARPAWALVTGSVVFLCSTGHGGKLNEWLSLPVFQVLVKLSYSVYLVQMIVILFFTGSKRHSDHFNYPKLFHDYIGDLGFIFIVATIWCLAFESPYVAIGKTFFKKALKELSDNQSEEKTKTKRKNKKGYVVCVYKYDDDQTIKKLN